jgi:hypothetical protein
MTMKAAATLMPSSNYFAGKFAGEYTDEAITN